jgi:hexosaminidase
MPNINSISNVNPIEINKSQTVIAAYFENCKKQSDTIEQTFLLNKATGKKITLVNLPHENYSNGGALTLIDGVSANRGKLGKDWLGFSGKDMNATIDLGKSETINKVTISVLESQGSWVYYPKQIGVLTSIDGENYKPVTIISSEEIKANKGLVVVTVDSRKVQFIKIIAYNIGKITEGNPGAGSDAWLFVDEIGVE